MKLHFSHYIAIILFVIGVGLYCYSMTLSPYTDEEAFYEKYQAIEGVDKNGQFHELRETYLSCKYQLEDYSRSIAVLGLAIFVFFFKGWKQSRTPPNKNWVFSVGILSAIFSSYGFFISLFISMERGEFPHWADSIAIAIPGYFVASLLILIVSVLISLLGLKKSMKHNILINSLTLKNVNYLWVVVFSLSLLITGYLLCVGDFLLTISGVLWSYFYLCILAGNSRIEEVSP